MDSYTKTLQQLSPYVHKQTFQKTFSDLGGISRRLPTLENTQTLSCHVQQYLSNDLDERWIRALHVALICSTPAPVVHNRFRQIASTDFPITFSGPEETFLSTRYSREVISVKAFAGQNGTNVFVTSRLSGYTSSEIASYLFNPLSDLTADYPLKTRLVSIEARQSSNANTIIGILEQRWESEDVGKSIHRLLENLNQPHWEVISDAEAVPARLQHTPSGNEILLDKAAGHGKQELRAKLVVRLAL